jgi:excisionase family DNA binding protein
MSESTELLTVPEACALLKISRPTLYRMRRDGLLRIVKVVSLSRVPKSDIDRIAGAYQEPVGGLVGDLPKPRPKKIKLLQPVA